VTVQGPREVTQRCSEAMHVSAAILVNALQRCTDLFVNKFSL